MTQPSQPDVLSNADIADRLLSLAQMLTLANGNPYKARAYRRAAAVIRGLGESIYELVRDDSDLTVYTGIGDTISRAIREIVTTGTLKTLENLRSGSSVELVELSGFPRLDPKRMLRIYKKLDIHDVASLRNALDQGIIEKVFGNRTAQHVRLGLVDTETILLYHAHPLAGSIAKFLLTKTGAKRVYAVGEYRRLVEIISRFDFIIESPRFEDVAELMKKFGGRTAMIASTTSMATYSLPAGPLLHLEAADKTNWGISLIRSTGSASHLRKLSRVTGSLNELQKRESFADEKAFYDRFSMEFIPPELREGFDEVALAKKYSLPQLICEEHVLGDLHAHTHASDGSDSIEEMAHAAEERGYQYLGITDHTPSLKIANGQSVDNLWMQIRKIDKLNGMQRGIRILKSAEVDILADGSLDLPDDVLCELDYTVCSIHSRFALDREKQTERVLRAMDSRFFTILGHATGRLLLKRPGYVLDFDRIVAHAKDRGCFFELNCSPDRLDLSVENTRLVTAAGIKIAISTDSHSTGEFRTIRYGIEQGRRAGLQKADVLNCQPLATFLKSIKTGRNP